MTNNCKVITENEIVDNKEMRNKYIKRVEVLDKVKVLLLIPEMEVMTIRQVADYYETSLEVVKWQFNHNSDEFISDGSILKTPKDFKIFNDSKTTFKDLQQQHGKLIIQIDDNTTLEIPNRGIRCFPKRAILRMGMLLRDSEVAKEVRTQLLNIVQHTSEENPELLTADINKEQQLLLGIGQAYSSGNIIEVLKATQALDSFRQRHIKAIEKENVSLANSNKLLTTEILKISDRKSMSRVMRMMVNELGLGYSEAYAMVYKQLNYRYGINLKSRGDKSKPYVKHLRDNEWKLVQKIIVAILEENNVDTTKFFEKCKIVKSKK